ncbi:hypothetical protein LOTGIDRAFT_176754 [Lottia gigantea]|uniref:Asl1-like glycosyl hydrolase catalytic domain-containing protein n=1 Tax=Lottia gigantea TaxID=225164 RepID=V4AC74_LOTGI|nr:hypothetical protein LOTGIDRAFT_176754 [Lottia gigantea]ESO92705.1 hypothetical protein LOTGIDRAFT_176754 [Lottia gigantea]
MNLAFVAQVVLVLLVCEQRVDSSYKRGFGMYYNYYECGDTYALNNTYWWYNWHYNFTKDVTYHCPRRTRGEYLPMIANEADTLDAEIPPESKYVLGFNEPNEADHMSPEWCAELWPRVEKIAGGRILVSPALAACDIYPDMCIDWYERFFKACSGCRVDKIAVHGYHCVPYELIQSLGKISSHFNRPIWLTEFACHGNVSSQDQINFMNIALPLLEQASFVERYAWFSQRSKEVSTFMPNFSNNLLKLDSPTLTSVGTFYNNY